MRLQHLFVVAALLAATSAQASVQISSNPTHNMDCSDGVCTPTAKNADLNATDLANMLAASDVKVVTGSGAVTITVSAPFSWTSSHRLTLDAKLNVSFRAPVEVAGQGAVTIVTKHGRTGGDLLFFPGGKIDFWDTGATFVFNGTSCVLVNDIASIAAAYAANNFAALALAKDYDAGPDGTYHTSAVPTPMDGMFEGLGHTISNFSASAEDRQIGFFASSGALSDSSVIRDLTLSNANVTGGADSLTGAVVGQFLGTITNAHSSGIVSAGSHSLVGGLAGGARIIFNSDSSAAVACTKRCGAGGLSGAGGQITLSHASGTVTVGNRSWAGGLVADLGADSISQSYSTGDVVSQDSDQSRLGGLAGGVIQNSTISDSYALGAIHNQGLSSLGGLIGYAQANTVNTSYAAGTVGSETASPSTARYAGGFVGFADFPQDYHNAYWDVDSSGTGVACGRRRPRDGCHDIQGLSDAQLKSGLPAGFSPSIWAQNPNINNGYPYLLANQPQ